MKYCEVQDHKNGKFATEIKDVFSQIFRIKENYA